jgi:hypothetical protein
MYIEKKVDSRLCGHVLFGKVNYFSDGQSLFVDKADFSIVRMNDTTLNSTVKKMGT